MLSTIDHEHYVTVHDIKFEYDMKKEENHSRENYMYSFNTGKLILLYFTRQDNYDYILIRTLFQLLNSDKSRFST